MSNNPQDQKFKKWLDILQQESWQLELIISGFAIYGLFMMIDPIELAAQEAENNSNMYRVLLMQGLNISWYIITINLIAHVVLRGLWIGAIGLRYVSGEIDYEKLNYSPKFARHLNKRVGSFDNYVANLEKYCSIIFAITFLLVFYLLGLLIIVFVFTLMGLSIDKDETPNWVRLYVLIPTIIFLAIGTILTFIDFATQGWLKKKKWISRFYYPIYWVFKYLTLSFLYRPMVYNFLDTKFGKRLSLVIVPLYLGLFILSATGFSTSNYLESDMTSNSYIANNKNYLDTVEEQNLFVDRAAIPSKIITDPYLQVFVEYAKSVEDDVFFFNKELKPEEDRRGIYSIFSEGVVPYSLRNKYLRNYLETIEDMYTLEIDSIAFKPQFIITEISNKQMGFETFLDMKAIGDGKHTLRILRKDHSLDSVYNRSIIRIPFWYYRE
ncbi:hypothetical protein [Lentiprolixibacter aurantiacus]|uniref:Uncharacterized protein n=1 Tax=Lentiprolixibacter aurantiacus TaxID=2993939 RepID=A0AAE3SPB6_9FLAO|nr:hypothetical protein [Lentiprolixibacter aurantiacus]MCX2719342.1 hypothetical protein [Lentiprolixibacter aurantiacus]